MEISGHFDPKYFIEHQTNSTLKVIVTAFAAFWRADHVTFPLLGSTTRSSRARLVFMVAAILTFVSQLFSFAEKSAKLINPSYG